MASQFLWTSKSVDLLVVGEKEDGKGAKGRREGDVRGWMRTRMESIA